MVLYGYSLAGDLAECRTPLKNTIGDMGFLIKYYYYIIIINVQIRTYIMWYGSLCCSLCVRSSISTILECLTV